MIKRYEDYLSRDDQGNITLSMKAQVTIYSESSKRFIYNNTPISYQQFFTDPVLVLFNLKLWGYVNHISPI